MGVKISARIADQEYASSIKKIRNKMRSYSYMSVLDGLLVYLNAPFLSNRTEVIKRLPWVAERLMLWLLRDDPLAYKSVTVTKREIQKIINLAWNNTDKVLNKDPVIKQLGLFVRQHMLPQMPYQMELDTHAFALQLYLVQQLPENSKLRIFLDQRAGMPINDYYEMALIYWINTLNPEPWFNANYINSLAPVFAIDKQEIFLNSLTSSINELQLICKKEALKLTSGFNQPIFIKLPVLPIKMPLFQLAGPHYAGISSLWPSIGLKSRREWICAKVMTSLLRGM